MELDFAPQPHEEAIALIRDKPVVTREVFDQMLPEIRGRVFTITGIEGANTLERIRDTIAGLPQGGADNTWDKVKERVVADLEPFLGDGAEKRAELLIRTHGFQAFQASNWRVIQQDEDTTHIQYLTMEDERVRESHAALDGVVLPKDDDFWDTHTPPWDWGCRCRIRAMNPDLVDMARAEDETRPPDDQLVIEGPALDQLNTGRLIRDGQSFDVTPPSEKRDGSFKWHPNDLRLPLADLEKRYEPEVFADFKKFADHTELSPRLTVLDWLQGKPTPLPTLAAEEKHSVRLRKEVGIAIDAEGNPIARRVGSETGVSWTDREFAAMAGGTMSHNHPSHLPPAPADYSFAVRAGLNEMRIVVRDGVWVIRAPESGWGKTAADREARWKEIQKELIRQPLRGSAEAKAHQLVVLFRQIAAVEVVLL